MNYLNFIKEKGISLSEFNPGSDEFALSVPDAILAIDMLEKAKIAILGGDIISIEDDRLRYAYQFWGPQYHSLNWSCDKTVNEDYQLYLERTYQIAKDKITFANQIAKELSKSCLIVLVI